MDSDAGIMIKKNSKDLPHEVVMDILSRLPVQNLFKFICVSRTWLHSITQDPHFARSHSDRSLQSNKVNPKSNASTFLEQNNNLLMAIDYTASNILIQFNLPFPARKWYDLCGFCNGLLCYSCRDCKYVYIWNPLTKDFITIPCSPMPPARFPDFKTKTTQFGFGYDPGRNEYKVVRVFCETNPDEHNFHTQISVYTLGVDSSWRTVVEDLQYCLELGPGSKRLVPFVNGVLHWLAHKPETYFDRIVGFDVRDEVFTELMLLTDIDFNDGSGFHTMGEEVYGLYSIIVDIFNTDVQVWQMRKKGAYYSWTKLLRVATPEAFDVLFYLESLVLAQNGKDELKLKSDPDDRTIVKIKQFAGLKFFHNQAYVPSIISPRFINGASHNLTEKRTRRSRKRKRYCDCSSI